MFDLEKSIQKWLRQFRRHKEFNDGSIKEMESHLRDYIDDLRANGLDSQVAFEKAVAEFGPLQFTAREAFKSQKPKYKSNTAMLTNYFKIAFRNFWKHRSYATLNIAGLTIGLTIVFLIGLFVNDELSFDQFHENKKDLYRVVENQYYAGQPVFPVAVTPTALATSLESEYPEIIKATRASTEIYNFKLDDQEIMEDGGLMVDHQFFEMFSFELLNGSLSSFKERLDALVLTESMVEKYFPDGDAIGKFIELDDGEYEVLAVMKDVPKNSHLDFKYLTNFESYLAGDSSRANNWSSNWLYTYVQLTPDADHHLVNEKVIGQIKANNENSVTDIYMQPLSDIYLGEVSFTVEVSRKGELLYVRIFSIVAVFILLISCINFMNLSTARSSKRAKEVGLRKTIGASRGQLIVQFLSESVFLTLVSVLLSIGFVALILPYFNQIANKEFTLQLLFQSQTGLRLLIGMFGIAIVTGFFAGSYPAAFLSAIKPIRTLNANATSVRGGLLRKVLVVLQFTISIVLIIGTLVIYRQFQFIQNVDLGYNKNHLIYLFAPSQQSRVFADELRKISGVEGVALSNRHPAYVLSSSSGFNWPGKNQDESILLHYMGVDEHYLSTMEMKITEGRDFLSTDSATLIINERAREMMGLENPVGQTITAYGEHRIVGVVDNFNFKSIHSEIEPLVIFRLFRPNRVYVRFDPKEEANITSKIEKVWADMFPNSEFNSYFLDTDFNEMYEAEERTGRLSTYFAVLAIIISCLGLFGLVSYATEQRRKEIGIRKVLGASIPGLFVLLTTDFTRLVLISLVIAIPFSWYAMNGWLEGYAYRVDISIWIFIASAALAMLIALATVSYQSIKASISNPVNALRNE